MNTGPKPVNGEPARTALRGMVCLLEVVRVYLFEAGLQVGQACQRSTGRDDALRRGRSHIAIGHYPPSALALRHDTLDALDAAQRAGDIGSRSLDQDGMPRAQNLVGELHHRAHQSDLSL